MHCVCFAAMVCLVVSSGIGGYAIFEITAPELTMRAHTYDKYQTNDAYWKTINRCYGKIVKNQRGQVWIH